MKAAIPILALLILSGAVYAEEFKTKVNVTISGNDVDVYGENGAHLHMFANSSGTQDMEITIDRETDTQELYDNLTQSYIRLEDRNILLYDAMISLNESCNQNKSDYFEQYSECFTNQLVANASLDECRGELSLYQNKSDECAASLNGANNQLQSASNELVSIQSTNQELTNDVSAKNLYILLAAAAAGVGGWFGRGYFGGEAPKRKREGKEPGEGAESLEVN